MPSTETNTTIINGYIGLLENLSPDNKLDLISKLSASFKTGLGNKKSTFKKSFVLLYQKKQQKELLKKYVTAECLPEKLNRFNWSSGIANFHLQVTTHGVARHLTRHQL